MFDETDVDFSAAELPADGGDLGQDGGVVAGSDGTQQGSQDRLIPARDLDRLRSTADKRYSQLERQFNELQQKLQQQETQGKRQARLGELTDSWTRQYMQQGHDAQTARAYARQFAEERVRQEFDQEELKSKVQTYEQREQEQQRKQTLTRLRDAVLERTGLTQEQLKQATRGLDPSDPNFTTDVWDRALAFQKSAGKQGQAQSARDIRNRTPFLAGGAPAQAQYQELPHNVKLGSDTGKAWFEEQKRLRRGRQRG